MKLLIIEDEQIAAQRLVNIITEIKPQAEILAIIDSVEESINWLSSNQNPDLIFLDIQLSDGNSFEIFENIEISSPIIFTTTYNEYAIKAFELNSIDYLLKPINKEKLIKSFEKFESLNNKQTEQNGNIQLEQLLQKINLDKTSYRNRFLINEHDGYIPINAENIAYFYTEDNAVLMKTFDSDIHILNFSLDNLEKELDPDQFYRANRFFILSANSIVKIHNYFNYKLKVEVKPDIDKEIIISRKKVGDFKRWMGK